MGITVIGFWTLYILLLAVVLTQYMSQFYNAVFGFEDEKGMCVIKWFGHANYYYRDTLDGFQIPTVLVLITWVWLLVGGLLHETKLHDANCGSNLNHERIIFWSHLVGVVAVLIVIPLLHGSKHGNTEASENAVLEARAVAAARDGGNLRSTNRFTTRAQIAVDVNTPLNFA